MRLLCCGSSLLSSLSAVGDSSTFQAMTFQYVFERNGALLAAANALQRLFGKIDILQIIEMLEDGLTDIIGLGAPGAAGQLFKAFFNGLRKPDSKHEHLAQAQKHGLEPGQNEIITLLLRRVALRARPCAWRSLFPRVHWAHSRSVKTPSNTWPAPAFWK